MLEGVDPRAVEGTTLTQSLLLPDRAVPTRKSTSKLALAPTVSPLGVAVTSVTAPDGAPTV